MKPAFPATLAVLALVAMTGSASAAAQTPPPVAQQRSAPGCLAVSKVAASGTPWTAARMGLAQAHQLSTGRGITVAVLGSGVEQGASKQLAGQVVDGPTIAGHGSAAKDCVGHGTVLAGLIAARPLAGTGFVGIAPGARIYSLSVTDATGAATAHDIAEGIDAAVAAHAQVIDVGVTTSTPSEALAKAVSKATAAGSLVVAPAAADGQTQAAKAYPAAYPGVLSVTASGPDGVLPNSEAIGAPIDLTAPGNSVIGIGPGGGVYIGSGPSFATAFAAGTAALVMSYLGALPPAELLQRLEATAVHPGNALPSAGYGELDPFAALTTLLPAGVRFGTTAATAPATPNRITVVRPPAAEARNAAFVVAASSLMLVVVVVMVAAVVPRGCRRSWRPGHS